LCSPLPELIVVAQLSHLNKRHEAAGLAQTGGETSGTVQRIGTCPQGVLTKQIVLAQRKMTGYTTLMRVKDAN